MPKGQPKEITIGQEFGNLIVVEKATNIKGKSREYGAWKCKCICNNEKIVAAYHLNRGDVKSCGCLPKQSRVFKPGDKIHRLTMISFKDGWWDCQCECGNIITIQTIQATSGNTKSCGCLKLELLREPERVAKLTNKQYESNIASARRVWRGYTHRDEKCNITFEQFFDLSQQNCTYCGIEPNTTYNWTTSCKEASEMAKETGNFKYNGLDRKDNALHHTLDNCVPCCKYCNRAKNDRNVEEFMTYIDRLHIQSPVLIISHVPLPENNYLLTSIKGVYRTTYQDQNISLSDFYSISQMPCHYCRSERVNEFCSTKNCKRSSAKSKIEGVFKYNGLDRIDSSLGHFLDNVLPCCYYCNFAKGKQTYDEFCGWIRRVKEYNKYEYIKQ